jgi:apolipoprotein N-acyltransferase
MLRSLLNKRLLLAAGSGLALACAFPHLGLAGLAWLAPGLTLASTLGMPSGGAFRLGYLAGLAQALVSLYWLLFNPFPAGAVAGWLALSAYVAVYRALWAWFCSGLLGPTGRPASDRLPTPPVTAGAGSDAPATAPGPARRATGGSPSLRSALARLAGLEWWRRAGWCLAGAAAWVACEMILARLFSGFAWNFLGVSQYRAIPLIQMATVTGVYGVSFIVAWTSLALLCTAARLAAGVVPSAGAWTVAPTARLGSATLGLFGWPQPGRPQRPRLGFGLGADLALPGLAVLAVLLLGGRLLWAPPADTPTLKVAAVQPSIPQRLIFDPRETTNRFNALMELSRLALAAKPDLLVWPEASLPGLEATHYRALTNLIATHQVWMVLGADDAEPRPAPAGGHPRYDQYNSAFLFGPDGRYRATYRKQHLVIFGEYVPLEDWLPFVKYLTPISGSLRPGPGPVPFQIADPPTTLAVLICFEDVFPEHARAATRAVPHTDILLNLTNDGWFGESAAQWQQAAIAAFRAVENRRPLVRCTNNGLTCWIDPFGRIRDAGFTGPDDIYAAGFKVFDVPRLGSKPPAPTFYQAHGDAFGWGCVATTAILVLTRVLGRSGTRAR